MGSFIDLTGQSFGKWKVLKQKGSKNNQLYWECQCQCGTVRLVNGNSLRQGLSTNCGCQRKQALKDNYENLKGQKFNDLTVLERVDGKWKCQCKCGNISYVSTTNLKSGNIKRCRDCGFLESAKKRTVDLTGKTFGLLTVIKQAPSISGKTSWLCRCECGNEKVIHGSSLKRGLTKSCGCQKSFGEHKIIQILTNNNINFVYQKTFSDCVFPDTKKNALFDFFVENKYVIEYDGQQHFTYTNNGWSTKESYEALKKRDNFKNQYCKDKNIPIIRIPYTHLEKMSLQDLQLETTPFLVFGDRC